MSSRLILHSVFIVALNALMSHVAASSAEGPPDDLMRNVIRIIGFHEQLLQNHSEFAMNKIDIAKITDEKEKLELIKILHRTTKDKKALRSETSKKKATSTTHKTPLTHVIPIGALPAETSRNPRRSGCFGEKTMTPKKKPVDSNAEFRRKIAELTEFMLKHYDSTMYFYSEMERIKRQREIYDELRRMVRYLEQPRNEFMKKAALQCYKTEVLQKRMTTNFWGTRTPNNLNINVVREPINEGLLGP